MTLRFERVTFLDEAVRDLHSLAERSRAMLVEVFRLLKALDAGALSPVPLHDYAKRGDLTDCGKIVVVLAGEPEHRSVVRDLGGGGLRGERGSASGTNQRHRVGSTSYAQRPPVLRAIWADRINTGCRDQAW